MWITLWITRIIPVSKFIKFTWKQLLIFITLLIFIWYNRGMDVRQCSICKESKPLTSEYFHKQSANKSGFGHYCKPCQSQYIKNRRDSKGQTVFDRLNHTKTHRVCRSCGKETPNKEMKNKRHWHSYCKSCRSEYTRRRNISQYGITPDDYKVMLDKQNGTCYICKKFDTKALAVDHDHDTGKVRGLLCTRCNRGIGLFGDSPDLLARAAEYLTTKR